MRNRSVHLLAATILLASATAVPRAVTAQAEGDYLYNVTMVRAAPGHWLELIDALEESAALHEAAGDVPPFMMRHSQGDQWDFMLIHPMGSREEHYEGERVSLRESVWRGRRGTAMRARLEGLIAYHEEWFARSVPLGELSRRFEGTGLFHIEMFAGLPGQRAELVEQRRMENRYYDHLDRQLNLIFVHDAGPNWDAMTIGFYPSLQAYAEAGVRYSESEQDEAARVAGFDGVGSIAPYLRSLLSYHRDTLAVRVR